MVDSIFVVYIPSMMGIDQSYIQPGPSTQPPPHNISGSAPATTGSLLAQWSDQDTTLVSHYNCVGRLCVVTALMHYIPYSTWHVLTVVATIIL